MLHIGDWRNGSAADFDSVGGSSILSSPARCPWGLRTDHESSTSSEVVRKAQTYTPLAQRLVRRAYNPLTVVQLNHGVPNWIARLPYVKSSGFSPPSVGTTEKVPKVSTISSHLGRIHVGLHECLIMLMRQRHEDALDRFNSCTYLI